MVTTSRPALQVDTDLVWVKPFSKCCFKDDFNFAPPCGCGWDGMTNTAVT
jgi:hypothetical protein